MYSSYRPNVKPYFKTPFSPSLFSCSLLSPPSSSPSTLYCSSPLSSISSLFSFSSSFWFSILSLFSSLLLFNSCLFLLVFSSSASSLKELSSFCPLNSSSLWFSSFSSCSPSCSCSCWGSCSCSSSLLYLLFWSSYKSSLLTFSSLSKFSRISFLCL